jgi:hypothetical protein
LSIAYRYKLPVPVPLPAPGAGAAPRYPGIAARVPPLNQPTPGRTRHEGHNRDRCVPGTNPHRFPVAHPGSRLQQLSLFEMFPSSFHCLGRRYLLRVTGTPTRDPRGFRHTPGRSVCRSLFDGRDSLSHVWDLKSTLTAQGATAFAMPDRAAFRPSLAQLYAPSKGLSPHQGQVSRLAVARLSHQGLTGFRHTTSRGTRSAPGLHVTQGGRGPHLGSYRSRTLGLVVRLSEAHQFTP